jgi:hypothetical protein
MAQRKHANLELEGLLFDPTGEERPLETKGGFPIYVGTAHGFEEWKFKIETRLKALDHTKDEEEMHRLKATLASKVIEGLQGEALKIAMEIGTAKLNTTAGVPTLIANLDESIRGTRADEARELYRIGSRPHGPLTRQSSEPMATYVTRRKRWWTRLQMLDSTIQVSDAILTDFLLTASGITALEQIVVKSSVGNKMEFQVISDALRSQHAHIHEKEGSHGIKSQNSDEDRRPTKVWRSKTFTPRRPNFARRPFKAYNAAEDAAASQAEEEATSESESENEQCYTCTSCGPEDDFEDIEDRIEQDICSCYFASQASQTLRRVRRLPPA